MDNKFNPFDMGMGHEFSMPSANKEQGRGDNCKFLDAKQIMTPAEVSEKKTQAAKYVQPVDFPRHLFIPEGAEGVDLRKVVVMSSGPAYAQLMRWQAPVGAVTRFIKYGIFNDGDNAAFFDFKPTVNGNRILRYHGEPMADGSYHIALGLAPDFSDGSMMPCQLTLQPNDILEWQILNTSGVDTSMGVRMVGYFDTQQIRVTPKFG
jgi:hypothetical protein